MKYPRQNLYISLSRLLISVFKIIFKRDFPHGPIASEFEQQCKLKWRRKHCFSFSTARVSLFFYLRALNFPTGSKVLLTPLQIPDYINVILSLDLIPAVVEMDEDSHAIDLDALERQITEETHAVIVTYLSGIVPDIQRLKNIVATNNLVLIEDISQNYGARCSSSSCSNCRQSCSGYVLGSIGDAAIGSLSPGKTISSIGGGVLLLNDDQIAHSISTRMATELVKPTQKELISHGVWQIKVGILTSHFGFNYFTFYALLALSKFSPTRYATVQQPKSRYSSAPANFLYENPAIRRDLPRNFFTSFSDTQAQIALVTLNEMTRGVSIRQQLAKTLFEHLNQTS